MAPTFSTFYDTIIAKKQQEGNPTTGLPLTIEQLVLQKYFPNFCYDYNQLQQKTIEQEEQLQENTATLKRLTSENEELKIQIVTLQKELSCNNDNQ